MPAYFGRRRNTDDLAPPADEPEPSARDDVFDLIPPRANENTGSHPRYEEPLPPSPMPLEPYAPEPVEPPQPIGRNRHPVDVTDLTRLSIDNDGRLYWDGKPVEVRRRLLMSGWQIAGLGTIAVLVGIAAVGAALVATVSSHDFACKRGWTATLCPPPPAAAPAQPQTPPRFDIPA